MNTLITKLLRRLNEHRTTDVYFVGYPKTGNTWVRFMLGSYVRLACGLDETPLFDACDGIGRCARYCVGPAIRFTHRPLTWETQTAVDLNFAKVVRPFMTRRVVLLIRNPLDALVSSWCQARLRSKTAFDGDLVAFLNHPVWGLDKLVQFYRLWSEGGSRLPFVHLVKYEDLKREPEMELAKLLDYLSIRKNVEWVSSAVNSASFESMQKLERSNKSPRYQSSGLGVFATGDRNNPDAYHVRRGVVGGYRDYLSEEVARVFERRIAIELPTYTYFSSSDS